MIFLKDAPQENTQNENESLDGVIWSKCPKTICTAKRKLDALVAEGICLYNEGHAMIMTKLFSKAGISPGSNTVRLAQKMDSHRLRFRREIDTEKYKKYRKLVKSAKLREKEN
ncbi:hypothetical protein J6590_084135 [Homalodisca vitripennis]|nr:hypothetical protein J6590_084135 [Homalodisca vitripennis]